MGPHPRCALVAKGTALAAALGAALGLAGCATDPGSPAAATERGPVAARCLAVEQACRDEGRAGCDGLGRFCDDQVLEMISRDGDGARPGDEGEGPCDDLLGEPCADDWRELFDGIPGTCSEAWIDCRCDLEMASALEVGMLPACAALWRHHCEIFFRECDIMSLRCLLAGEDPETCSLLLEHCEPPPPEGYALDSCCSWGFSERVWEELEPRVALVDGELLLPDAFALPYSVTCVGIPPSPDGPADCVCPGE